MFARQVRDVAAPDVAKMGLEILSFIIKDVTDKHMYLDSLGKAQIAAVTRDAVCGRVFVFVYVCVCVFVLQLLSGFSSFYKCF